MESPDDRLLLRMKLTNSKLFLWEGGLLFLILIGVIIWYLNEPATVPAVPQIVAPLNQAPEKKQATVAEEKFSPNVEPTAPEPPRQIMIEPDRLRAIAKHTYLSLLDSGSLAINQAVVDLLGLNSKQTEELNQILKHLLGSIETEELAHAYVTTTERGEEIVVAAFDRSPLIEDFRGKVAAKLGKDVGDFVAEQCPFDHCLAIDESEMRLYIEPADDGLDRVVFEHRMRDRDAVDSKTPFMRHGIRFAPTHPVTVKALLGQGVKPRYNRLFSAAATLPRR